MVEKYSLQLGNINVIVYTLHDWNFYTIFLILAIEKSLNQYWIKVLNSKNKWKSILKILQSFSRSKLIKAIESGLQSVLKRLNMFHKNTSILDKEHCGWSACTRPQASDIQWVMGVVEVAHESYEKKTLLCIIHFPLTLTTVCSITALVTVYRRPTCMTDSKAWIPYLPAGRANF